MTYEESKKVIDEVCKMEGMWQSYNRQTKQLAKELRKRGVDVIGIRSVKTGLDSEPWLSFAYDDNGHFNAADIRISPEGVTLYDETQCGEEVTEEMIF